MSPSDTYAIVAGEAVETLDGHSISPAEPAGFSAKALDALYRTHGSRLCRFFARRVGHEEAADVVQEAFARLARILPAARYPIDRPEAFVTTVATNVLRDRARTAARHALRVSQLASEDHLAEDDPHRLVESREALRAVEHALAAMNPRRRRIFWLHRFEDLTYAQIGDEVGMSEKGVKKQMAKALVELRCAVERGE